LWEEIEMAQGQPGADSMSPVTTSLIQQSTDLYGTAPVFWGRYFTSPTTTGTAEYHHATENGPLNAAGVRVLPIARQTGNVGGSEQQGAADGTANAQDFVDTFGVDELTAQGGKFIMVLDVEGSPDLTSDYYTGWAQGLTSTAQSMSGNAVQMLPCLYASHGDTGTWAALGTAIANGAPCSGVWVARYLNSLTSGQMGEWSDDTVTPDSPNPFPATILAWQYAENCLSGAIDCTQTNPAIDLQDDFLQFLVLPPA
jgi:hypothetical protein